MYTKYIERRKAMTFEKDSLGVKILSEEGLQFGYIYEEKKSYFLMLFKDKLTLEELEKIYKTFKNFCLQTPESIVQ